MPRPLSFTTGREVARGVTAYSGEVQYKSGALKKAICWLADSRLTRMPWDGWMVGRREC